MSIVVNPKDPINTLLFITTSSKICVLKRKVLTKDPLQLNKIKDISLLEYYLTDNFKIQASQSLEKVSF